ncbi:MAG TPA: ATP-binding protein [Spirochaetota bacterium]|nr:ATP-binding protein [Spirochaetota bacterium]
MSEIEYRKRVAFVNRKKELEYLNSYIQSESENILFLHGPKSSGKTALLYKLIDKLNSEKSKYAVKHFNLREVLICSYKDFIRSFFIIEDKKEKLRKYFSSLSAGIFKISEELAEKLAMVKVDPFKIMKKELQDLKEQKIKPIIIIDELQALQDIYMNGNRLLINEIFNFFVSITKETHLAHVIVGSSDGYFIDQIYNDSKLKKTSKFYEIDYLTKEDVWEWLSNLEKYSKIKDYILTEKEIQKVWDTLGGSCWEIQSLLSDFFDDEVEKVCEEYKIKMKNLIADYIKLSSLKNKILNKFVLKIFNKYVDFSDTDLPENKIEELLSDMVHNNILYYNPTTAEFYPQGKSLEWGIKLYFKI